MIRISHPRFEIFDSRDRWGRGASHERDFYSNESLTSERLTTSR